VGNARGGRGIKGSLIRAHKPRSKQYLVNAKLYPTPHRAHLPVGVLVVRVNPNPVCVYDLFLFDRGGLPAAARRRRR